MLVTSPPLTLVSAEITWLQSRRTISSTASTAKPCVERAYSVTSMMFRPDFGWHSSRRGRSITGITWPRMSAMPRMDGSAPTTVVTEGITRISRTLNTLMPNSSDCPLFAASPSRNNSSSN
ncbi:hypothetical protein D3C81_1777960 [compost metagenome]